MMGLLGVSWGLQNTKFHIYVYICFTKIQKEVFDNNESKKIS